MKSLKGEARLGATFRIAVFAGLLILTACAAPPASGGRYVDRLEEWKAIDIAEADLNLPLVTPLEIASLERRVGEVQGYQDIYTFQGVEGYVKTSRVISGIYPQAYANSLRAGRPRSSTYIAGLSLPSVDRIDAPFGWAFLNGKSHNGRFLSRGFTAEGSARPYYDNCFVARTAYLFVELEAIERSDDAVDTVIEVLLCGNRGDLPRYTDLVRMMARVDAVKDREAFREELSRRADGAT